MPLPAATALSDALVEAATADAPPRLRLRCAGLAELPATPGAWGALPALLGRPETGPAGHAVAAAALNAPWAGRALLHPDAPLDLWVDAGGAATAHLPLQRARDADALMEALLPDAPGAPGGPWIADVGGEPLRGAVESVDGRPTLVLRSPGGPAVRGAVVPTLAADLPDTPGCGGFSRVVAPRRDGTPAEEARLVLLPAGTSGAALWRRAAPGLAPEPEGPPIAAPRTSRPPAFITAVGADPGRAAGLPLLQGSRVPDRLSTVAALIPARTGLQPTAGAVFASWRETGAAGSLMVLPVRLLGTDTAPADADLLHAVAGAAGQPHRRAAEAPGGARLSLGPDLHLGAASGRLLVATDEALLLDALAGQGPPWFDGAAGAALGASVAGFVWPGPAGAVAVARIGSGHVEVRATAADPARRAAALADAVSPLLELVPTPR
jgi:hypothetical protein